MRLVKERYHHTGNFPDGQSGRDCELIDQHWYYYCNNKNDWAECRKTHDKAQVEDKSDSLAWVLRDLM